MTADRLLELVGVPGGPLADATLWHLEVVETGLLAPTMRRVLLTAPGLEGLRFSAGQDLMLRVPRPDGKVLNRRYTIRSFDATRPGVTIDVSLHGAGPGTDWIRAADNGDRIDAIGPRGKITLRTNVDQHFFIGDETGMPGALAMMEALPTASTATALLEIDSPADEQVLGSREGQKLEIRWLHRLGRSAPGDAPPLLEGLAELGVPNGVGHVYVAAEAGVVRSVQRALVERGLRPEQISAKAYWRRGLPNLEHGEPARET